MANSEFPALALSGGGGGGAGGGLLHQATVELTDAQIKGSPSVFPTVVAAQGANTIILLRESTVIANFSAGAYTDVDGDSYWYLAYGDDDKQAAQPVNDDGAYFAFAGQTLTRPLPAESQADLAEIVSASKTLADFIDAPIKFVAINGQDFTGGNAANTITISVAYLVLDTTTGQFVAP